MHRLTATITVLLAAATMAVAAAPAVPVTTLATDPVGDTTGLGSAVDPDASVDITQVTYQREGQVLTFTVQVRDADHRPLGEEFMIDFAVGVSFMIDGDCTYAIGSHGRLLEYCPGERPMGRVLGPVQVDLAGSDGYRLNVDLDDLEWTPVGDLRAGAAAGNLEAATSRRGLRVLVAGCGFCGHGQSDSVEAHGNWTL